MIFDILTLFPDIFTSFLSESLLAKALTKKIITVNLIDIRDFTHDRHRTADDRPYGGGPGMVLKPEPLSLAIESCLDHEPKPHIIHLTPSGQLLNQDLVVNLAHKKHILLICGRYEGVDQRVIDLFADQEISVGDYVVNGGEVPAMLLVEALSRLQPGFMGRAESAEEESHSLGLLEYPLYTRPRVFRNLAVPDILVSGHHAQVATFRLAEALAKTRAVRPELLKQPDLEEKLIKSFERHFPPHTETVATSKPSQDHQK